MAGAADRIATGPTTRIGWIDRLTTDDLGAAMATAAMLAWIASAAVVVSTAVDLATGRRGLTDGPTLIALPIAAAIAGAGLAMHRLRGFGGRLLALALPLLGVGIVLTLNLVSHDATAGAQFGFALMVLYAAAHLRDAGVALITVLAIGALAITAWVELPDAEAFSDTVSGAVILTVVAIGLVSARRIHGRAIHELRLRADTDPISGALQRHVLDAALERAIADEHAAGTALLIVDVDHFKSINDGYGHPAGDEALRHLTSVLRQRVRPLDAVSRMGGDEFAMLLPDCAHAAAIDRAGGLLRDLQARPLQLGDRLVAISVSVGVAHSPTHAHDVEGMYAAADRALYRAKAAGRGRVEAST